MTRAPTGAEAVEPELGEELARKGNRGRTWCLSWSSAPALLSSHIGAKAGLTKCRPNPVIPPAPLPPRFPVPLRIEARALTVTYCCLRLSNHVPRSLCLLALLQPRGLPVGPRTCRAAPPTPSSEVPPTLRSCSNVISRRPFLTTPTAAILSSSPPPSVPFRCLSWSGPLGSKHREIRDVMMSSLNPECPEHCVLPTHGNVC